MSITPRLIRRLVLLALSTLAAWDAGATAQASPLYTISDLGTLPGKTSSVATAINNQGQVVGISYNSSEGSFATGQGGRPNPPRFTVTGGGAQSFLYGNDQLAQISPTGGLALSINNSGQVVGGPNPSINDVGQYVSGVFSGILPHTDSAQQLISGSTSTALSLDPYAINNAGQIAGAVVIGAHGGTDSHPAIYQNGQVTDLFSKVWSGTYVDSQALAINQKGDVLITVAPYWGAPQSFLYHTGNGSESDLTSLPGGSGMIAAALNNNDQVVGSGSLYSGGVIQTLASLLPAPSVGVWSALNATGINDSGQIVGQGLINGQEHAFLMTPDANQVPEPGALTLWALAAVALGTRSFGDRRNKC